MNSRVHFLVLFLLAATVSVVADVTERLQEIHVDIVDSEDGSLKRAPNDAILPHQQQRARRRRMPTDMDRQVVIGILNRLRRSLGAPDMYYATSAEVPRAAQHALGLTGYTRANGVDGEIQKAYFQGPNSTFYWQIMSSHLLYVGCAVSDRPCKVGPPHEPPVYVFTCLFAYSRPMSKWLSSSFTSGSPTCSQCDNDALWCDAGLCRTKCQSGDNGCVRSDRHDCEKTCSSCDTAVSDSPCQCVCYYANDRRRCTDKAMYATKNRPVCHAAPTDTLQTPAGFLSLTVCVLLAFIIVCIFMACCITRCRLRKRSQRRSSGAAGSSHTRELDDGSAATELSAPSAFVVGPPIVLSPPPYADMDGADSRPPPYYGCSSYQTSSTSDGSQPGLCSVADLPSPTSMVPTAPSTLNNCLTSSNSEQAGVRHPPAYRNQAFSDPGV